MKYLFILYCTSVLIIISSCEDSDSINSSNGINLGELQRDTLIATESRFIEHGKVSTGFSSKLLLGSYNNYECRFLVKFSDLPADTIILDSVYFLIQSAANIGTPLSGLSGEIKLVTKEWDENVNTDDDFSYLNDVSNSLSTTTPFTILNRDSFDYSIPVPDTLISIWRDTTGGENNHGLLLDYTNADYVKIFNSENSSVIPKLVYVYKNSTQDSTIRDTVFASIDASLIEFTGNLQSDSLLYITSGYSHRTFLKFNLDVLPENILISHANLVINQDTLNSVTDTTSSNNFYVRVVTTPINDLPTYVADSTFSINLNYNISLSETQENQLNIRSSDRGTTGKYFIQSLINQQIQYESFLIHYVGEGITISQYAIKGVNNVVERNRPKLILEYYIIPDSRI